jgi:hypothetical protein
MPSEDFPQPKSKELSQKELEGLLEVKVAPGETLNELLVELKKGGFIHFLVTENFDVFLSTSYHNTLMRRLQIDRDSCLLPDGAFKISESEIKFFNWLGVQKVKNIQAAAENKIKDFLKD